MRHGDSRVELGEFLAAGEDLRRGRFFQSIIVTLALLLLSFAGTLPSAFAQTNAPPVANANGPYAGTAGTAIQFSAAGSSDPDGSIVSYSWQFGDGGTGAGQTAAHTYTQAGTYVATLTVVDNAGASASATANVVVAAAPTPPPPTEPPPPPPPTEPPPPPPPTEPPPPPPAEPPPPPPPPPPPNVAPRPNANGPYTATVGVPLQLSSAGSTDSDGTITAYRWMFGDGASSTAANPTHTYSAAGTYTATLTVTDDDGATASTLATVNVAPPPNRAPTATADSYRTDEDQLLGVSAAQGVLANDTDPDGNTLRAELVTNVASGTLTLEPSGAFTYRPPEEFAGTVAFTYRASDGTAVSAAVTVTIAVPAVNDAPTGSVPAQTGTENLPLATPFDLAPLFTDREGNAISFTVTGLPPGLAATPAGLITGAPSIGAGVGDWNVRVVATDNGSPPATTTVTFPWRVLAAGRADLAVTAAVAPLTVLVGGAATFSYTVDNPSQSDVANVAVTVEFAGGSFTPGPLPAGCGAATAPAAIECRAGPLPAGQSLKIEIAGTAGPAGEIVTSGTVRISDPMPIDANPGNDTGRAFLGIAETIGVAAQALTSDGHRASVAADFDGDGHRELAVATDARFPVLIYANVADPNNGRKRILAAAPTSAGSTRASRGIAAADFDADGAIDLVTAGDANALLLNRTPAGGPIAFAESRTLAAADAVAVATGDLDGDARPDIVFAGGSRAAYANAGGTWTRMALSGDGATRAVVVVNVAGDALPEVVFVGADGNALVYPNTGGSLGAPVAVAVGGATSVAAADFDGDGDIDLAFGVGSAPDGSMPANVLFANVSSGAGPRFERGAAVGVGGTIALAAQDIDANGTADLIAIRSGGSHSVYRNAGGASFSLAGARFDTAAATGVTLGTIGPDARNDVIVSSAAGTAVFFNDGRGRFGEGDTVPPVVTLRGAPAVDLKVDAPFQDPGATALDDVDGDLTANITVQPPVNTTLVGEQTITYVVADTSGNVAPPVTRAVRVDVNPPVGGGGGGAMGGLFALLLAAVATLRGRARESAPS
jgi:PKD repeat protein